MTLDNNPLEAGLNFFVKMKKETDFIGKQSLLDRKKRGFIPRKLVFMEVETDNVDPEGNETIWHDDKVSHPEHVDSYILSLLRSLCSDASDAVLNEKNNDFNENMTTSVTSELLQH